MVSDGIRVGCGLPLEHRIGFAYLIVVFGAHNQERQTSNDGEQRYPQKHLGPQHTGDGSDFGK